MKKGIAKFNAGIHSQRFSAADGGSDVIEMGRVYWVPDDYDFNYPSSIFDACVEEPIKERKRKGE